MKHVAFVALIFASLAVRANTQLIIQEGYDEYIGNVTWDNGRQAAGVIVSFYNADNGRLPASTLTSDGSGDFRAMVPKNQKLTAVATAYQTDDAGNMRILARSIAEVHKCAPDDYGYGCLIKLKLNRGSDSVVHGIATGYRGSTTSESFINVQLVKENWPNGLVFLDTWVKAGTEFSFRVPAGKYSLDARQMDNCNGGSDWFEVKRNQSKQVDLQITTCWIAH